MAYLPTSFDHPKVDNAVPAPRMQTAYHDRHASLTSVILNDGPPRYSSLDLSLESFQSLIGSSPPYNSLFTEGAYIPPASSEPEVSLSTPLSEIAESNTYIPYSSNEIEPYPIDVLPNFNPDSKEVRANLNLLPDPFPLSQASPQVNPHPQNKKAREYPDEKARQRVGPKSVKTALIHGQALLQDVATTRPQISVRATQLPVADTATDSPPHSPQIQIVKHTFQLKDSRGLPLLTMMLESKARNSKNTPVFYGGDSVEGQVYLSVNPSHSSIQAVTLTIIGQLVTSAFDNGIYTFLDQTVTLWSRLSSSSNTSMLNGSEMVTVVGSKLSGGHSWPFSFSFPEKATLHRGKSIPGMVVNTPQSLLEAAMGATVKYELVLRVCRGRFKSDLKLRTPVTYIPRVTPEPPSSRMQLAYTQNAPLAGPKVDREGWISLDTIITRGRIDKRPEVDVRYTLSLANPLCYTRGFVIPLSLTIDCEDPKALHELSSPKAISVILKRRIQYVMDSADRLESRYASENIAVEEGEVASAIWWRPLEDAHATTERRLEGEIYLKGTLQPSCDFPLFMVEYFVMLQPPRTAQFEPKSSTTLVTQRIRIGTFLPPGCPTPKSFTTEIKKRQMESSRIARKKETVDNSPSGFNFTGLGCFDLSISGPLSSVGVGQRYFRTRDFAIGDGDHVQSGRMGLRGLDGSGREG